MADAAGNCSKQSIRHYPHLAIVAHEIGHALYHQVPWDVSSFAAEQAALKNRISRRLAVPALDNPTLDILREVFSGWFQELACDAFAHYLTGPAMFFSFAEIVQFGGGYSRALLVH